MKRFLAFFCIFSITTTTPVMATNFQDWWWNADQNGMGVNVGHQGDTIAAAWYLYDSDGSSAFLNLSGTISNNVISGNLYRSTGPLPGPGYNPSQVNTVPVGTGSITFTSETTATLAYDYDGLSGSLNLVRFSYGSYLIAGDFAVSSTFTRSDCQSSALNFLTYDGHVSTVASDGSTMDFDQWAPPCTGSVALTQAGSIFTGSGTWSCLSGEGGTLTFSELRLSEDHFNGKFTQVWTAGETCKEVGLVSGIKIP